MKNFDHDHFSEGDWEEKGELAWNEFDWELFLQRQEREIRRFISNYNRLPADLKRIDEVAQLMGWDASDWSLTDLSSDYDGEDCSWKRDAIDDEESSDQDPYTVHRHPLFIAVSGLYDSVLYLWKTFLNETTINLSPQVGYDLVQSIYDGKMESLLALQSLDLADYALTVCELKRALKSLNRTLQVLESLNTTVHPNLATLISESARRLFDVREIWLRVIKDCREELDRRVRDDE